MLPKVLKESHYIIIWDTVKHTVCLFGKQNYQNMYSILKCVHPSLFCLVLKHISMYHTMWGQRRHHTMSTEAALAQNSRDWLASHVCRDDISASDLCIHSRVKVSYDITVSVEYLISFNHWALTLRWQMLKLNYNYGINIQCCLFVGFAFGDCYLLAAKKWVVSLLGHVCLIEQIQYIIHTCIYTLYIHTDTNLLCAETMK